MKKVIVIGTGHLDLEEFKLIHQVPEGVEIIQYEKIEDIPLEDRYNPTDISRVISNYELNNVKVPELKAHSYEFVNNKRKGHERPYKFHR
jgi:hypothetical protein